MLRLLDSPLAITAIAVVLGAAFVAVVYGSTLLGSLIFGGCVGVGAFLGQRMRFTQERHDRRRADIDGPDDT